MAAPQFTPTPVYPAIPTATDLASCIAAINALAQAFRILTKTGPGRSN
jgi:hypothetical protein